MLAKKDVFGCKDCDHCTENVDKGASEPAGFCHLKNIKVEADHSCDRLKRGI